MFISVLEYCIKAYYS